MSRHQADARALLEEAAAELALLDRPEDAAALRSHAATGTGSGEPPVAVVVGERKRGKSTLLNALIEAPGLLPVDADVATNALLTVRHADTPQAYASTTVAADAAPGERLAIDLDQLAEYAAVDPDTRAPRHPEVRRVVVGLPSHLLAQGIALVDTPGIGGLSAGHGALTRAVTEQADALVLVTSGGGELTESELRFLEAASPGTVTVLFVMAQTDKYESWPQVLDRNRELVAARVPGAAGAAWFPVSALRHEEAAEAEAAGLTEMAAVRRAGSGIGPLRDALLRQVAGRADRLRTANALDLAARMLTRARADRSEHLASLQDDPALHAALAERREQVRQLRSGDAAWRSRLREDLKRLEREVRHEYQRAVNELSREAQERIAVAGAAELQALPGELEAAVEALWLGLDRGLRRRAADAAVDLARAVDAEAARLSGPAPLPEHLRRLPQMGAAVPELPGTAERLLSTIGPGATAAGMLGGLAASGAIGAAAVGLVVPPTALVLAGIGGSVLLQRARRRRAEVAAGRAAASRHLQAVLREVQTEVPAALQEAVRGVGDEIDRAVTAELGERIRLAEAVLQEHEHAARAAERDVTERREQLADEVRRLAALEDRCEALLAAALGADDEQEEGAL